MLFFISFKKNTSLCQELAAVCVARRSCKVQRCARVKVEDAQVCRECRQHLDHLHTQQKKNQTSLKYSSTFIHKL